LNGEEGYQAGKYDANYANGYCFTPSKMKKDGLYFNEQAKAYKVEHLGYKMDNLGISNMVKMITGGLKRSGLKPKV
jgi:hypothetical protein